MNIIALGFNDAIYFEILRGLSKLIEIDHLEYYHDGNPGKFNSISKSNHGLHYLNIQSADYDVQASELKPLDEEILSSLSDCEQIVLRMLDRNNIYSPLTYAERKYLYLEHLRYWNHIIDNREIEFALFSNVPHGAFDFIIYSLCKLKNIKTILFTCPSLLTGRIFIANDWREPAPNLKKTFVNLINEIKSEKQLSIELPSDLEKHFIEQTGLTGAIPVPYHMSLEWFVNNNVPFVKSKSSIFINKLKSFFKLITKIYRINDIERMSKKIMNFFGHLSSTKIYAFYDSKTINPDLTCKFIYVPLQMQPEMTTSPMAGQFVDQQLMIHILSNALQNDTKLYIKEHPYQHWGGSVSRDISFYKDLLKIPNVCFLPRSYDTHELIKHSIAVATATGTAGWEGLFLGKPFLMFGHHIYQYAPGVFQIKSNKDCRDAMKEIALGYSVDIKHLRVFLKAIELTSLIGPTDSARKNHKINYDLEMIHSISHELSKHFKS